MEKLYNKPKLTYFTILVCIVVFIFEIFYSLQYGSFGGTDFNNALSNLFNDYGFSFQNLLGGRYWVFITSIFLHADPEHLILNMIALFFFGRVVEQYLGRKKFLLIFFSTGVAGTLAFMAFSLLTAQLGTVVIGASAAIFGLMGTAMLIRPLELVPYPYLIPIPLILVAVFYTFYNIVSFLLVATNLQQSDISFVSHIGGIVLGMFFGLKEPGSKKGLIIMIFLLILLVATPFLLMLFSYLEIFNYTTVLSNLFK